MRTLALGFGLVTLAFAACGGASPMTDADVRGFAAWSTEYQVVADEMLVLSSAMADMNLERAHSSVDKLDPKLALADAKAGAVGNVDVRDTLQDYMRITHRAVDSLAALVEHLETKPGKDPSDLLLTDLATSNADMLKEDGLIVDRVLEHASAQQRKAILAAAPPAESR
jgi:hypothetical protein